jgi:hypothetical protein
MWYLKFDEASAIFLKGKQVLKDKTSSKYW